MRELNSLAPDELVDRVWIDLLPWLDDYVSDRARVLECITEPSDWWLADTPAVTAAEANLEKVLTELADLFIVDHKVRTLAESFPAVDGRLPIGALGLSAVAIGTVRRSCPDGRLTTLLRRTVGDLFAARGTGDQAIAEIVFALLGVSVVRDPAAGVAPEVDESTAVIDQLAIDLAALADWRRLRGEQHAPLVEVRLDDEAPAAVQEVVRRLAAVTADDFPHTELGDPIAELERLIGGLDESRAAVLRRRLMGSPPGPFGPLAIQLHVSTSRVRSIEAELKRLFLRDCDFGTATGTLLAAIRMDMRPVAHLDRLIERHPVLAEQVPSLAVPLWFALDRFDDIFEVTDRWAAAPNVGAAEVRTLELLAESAGERGTAALDQVAAALGMPDRELRRWLDRCSVPVEGDAVIVDRGAPPSVTTSSRHRTPVAAERTRGLYRYSGGWRFRLVVTADHLRGSGFALSSGVAAAFGCAPDAVRTLDSRLGPQSIRYTGMQPTCGTIRRFLDELGCVSGDIVFLEVADTGVFDVLSRTADPDTPHGAALAAIGDRDPDRSAADAIAVLAAAVGMPDETRPRAILFAYHQRVADPVVPYLERAWVPNGHR